jgi:hypothetical protein
MPIAGDAMADPVDLSKLFAVDVDEFTGPFALVADDRRLDVQVFQAAKLETTEYGADG